MAAAARATLPRNAFAGARPGGRTPHGESPTTLMGCQSPMDSIFDPKVAPCQSPMDRFFEPQQAPTFFGSNVAAPPVNCMMMPPNAANVPVMPLPTAGFGSWPNGQGFMQLLQYPPPAGIAPLGQAPYPVPSTPGAFQAPVPAPAAPPPAASRPITLDRRLPGGQGQNGAQQAAPVASGEPRSKKQSQVAQKVSQAEEASKKDDKHACPTAIYIDLTCLKEKK